MEKIILNDYQNIFYFVWDNTDETIKMVNEYLKITKGKNWSCGRCWDDKTKSNTSDVLFISNNEGTSFFKINEYIIDYLTCFGGLKKEKFDNGDAIEIWKKFNIEQ